MSKWKCEICNSNFDNFQAQGFNNKIYCPLCYYKELYKTTELERERLNNIVNLIKNNIDITIQIIKEQPTGNDEWILERLNGIKNIGEELKEGKE